MPTVRIRENTLITPENEKNPDQVQYRPIKMIEKNSGSKPHL